MEPTIITITREHHCLHFPDLSPEDKETVLEQQHDLNIDHDWWDTVYDWFEEYALAEYGVSVDLKQTYFRGFSCQGDGAAFTGHVIDIEKVIACGKPTRRYHRPEEFNKVIRYMFNECDLTLRTKPTGFYNTSQASEVERDNANPHDEYFPSQGRARVHAEHALEWLEWTWEGICNELAGELYSALEREYDYQTSAECLAEFFEDNECVFEIGTGKMFYR